MVLNSLVSSSLVELYMHFLGFLFGTCPQSNKDAIETAS